MKGDLIYGIHAVAAALRRHPERIHVIQAVTETVNPRLTLLLEQASLSGITVQYVPRAHIDASAKGATHQGIMAWCEPTRTWHEADLPDMLSRLEEPALLLILDTVQDPHNLGACLRTADAAGAHAVIVPRDRAVGLTAVVRKVACGAVESMAFIQVTNLARTLRTIKETGIWLVGAAGEAKTSIYDTDLRGPVALIMGAEAEGLRRLTRTHCDVLVHIPMRGAVASLNVSVAVGIGLFETVRQRRCVTARR